MATGGAVRRRGWGGQVGERAVALREIGAGIQLSPNGMKVLRALGLEDAILQRGFLPEALEMRMGRSGFPIFCLPIKSAAQYRWRAPYVHIHRADLIDVLSQALEERAPGCVRLGEPAAACSLPPRCYLRRPGLTNGRGGRSTPASRHRRRRPCGRCRRWSRSGWWALARRPTTTPATTTPRPTASTATQAARAGDTVTFVWHVRRTLPEYTI